MAKPRSGNEIRSFLGVYQELKIRDKVSLSQIYSQFCDLQYTYSGQDRKKPHGPVGMRVENERATVT